MKHESAPSQLAVGVFDNLLQALDALLELSRKVTLNLNSSAAPFADHVSLEKGLDRKSVV